MSASVSAGWARRSPQYRPSRQYIWLWLGVVLALAVGLLVGRQPLAAAGLVVVAGGAFALLLEPGLAVFLLPLVPVTSGLARGVPIPGFRVSELLAVGVGFAVLVRGSMASGSHAPTWRALDWLALAYAAAYILVPLGDIYLGGLPGTSIIQLLVPLQYLLLYRASVICLDTRARRRRALQVILVSSTVTNIFAVFQAVNLPGVRPFINSLTALDPYNTPGYVAVPRATGLFPIWHVLAGFDVAIVMIALALLLNGQRIMSLWLNLVVVGLAIAGIAVSVTSTTAIGVVLGALMIGALSGRLRQVFRWSAIAVIAVGVLFWPVFSARISEQGYGGQAGDGGSLVPQTISYRWEVWTEQYLPAIGERPISGWGPQLPHLITWPYPENVYLSYLVRGGFILLVAYLAWMAVMFDAAWRVHKMPRSATSDEVSRSIATALFALLTCLAIMQLLFPYMLTTGLPGLVWIMSAIVLRTRSVALSPPPRPAVSMSSAIP